MRLAHLHCFSIDILKIDFRFIERLAGENRSEGVDAVAPGQESFAEPIDAVLRAAIARQHASPAKDGTHLNPDSATNRFRASDIT